MNKVRPTAAVALAIITREGKPLYLKSFETENELKYHFILHAALDHFEEKQAVEKTRCVRACVCGAACSCRLSACSSGVRPPLKYVLLNGVVAALLARPAWFTSYSQSTPLGAAAF
jgi:hypothetical protein